MLKPPVSEVVKDMKIAALIVAHHRPDCLQRLLMRLQGALWSPYLHLDAKSDVAQFSHLAPLAVAARQRVPVYWGHYSQVEAILVLLRQALEDSENTHFYLVTGQDYPIKDDAAIAATINEAAHGGNYITVRKMPTKDKPLSRLTRRQYFHPRVRSWRNVLRHALARGLPSRNLERHLNGIVPHAGSGMWVVDRQAAQAMVDFLDINPWYVQAFRHTLCPDEMFFQTLVVHLGVELDGGCPTRFFWIEGRFNPEIIDLALLHTLLGDWHFMARKFDHVYPE